MILSIDRRIVETLDELDTVEAGFSDLSLRRKRRVATEVSEASRELRFAIDELTSPDVRSRTASSLQRWVSLIEQHGLKHSAHIAKSAEVIRALPVEGVAANSSSV